MDDRAVAIGISDALTRTKKTCGARVSDIGRVSKTRVASHVTRLDTVTVFLKAVDLHTHQSEIRVTIFTRQWGDAARGRRAADRSCHEHLIGTA